MINGMGGLTYLPHRSTGTRSFSRRALVELADRIDIIATYKRMVGARLNQAAERFEADWAKSARQDRTAFRYAPMTKLFGRRIDHRKRLPRRKMPPRCRPGAERLEGTCCTRAHRFRPQRLRTRCRRWRAASADSGLRGEASTDSFPRHSSGEGRVIPGAVDDAVGKTA